MIDHAEPQASDRDDRETPATPARRPYSPPRVTRKQTLERATLFSGGGVAAVGLTTAG